MTLAIGLESLETNGSVWEGRNADVMCHQSESMINTSENTPMHFQYNAMQLDRIHDPYHTFAGTAM